MLPLRALRYTSSRPLIPSRPSVYDHPDVHSSSSLKLKDRRHYRAAEVLQCVNAKFVEAEFISSSPALDMVPKPALRLDDGSLINWGEDGVASRIPVQKAVATNKIGDKDCDRLEQFISTARSMAPRGAAVELASPAMVSLCVASVFMCTGSQQHGLTEHAGGRQQANED